MEAIHAWKFGYDVIHDNHYMCVSDRIKFQNVKDSFWFNDAYLKRLHEVNSSRLQMSREAINVGMFQSLPTNSTYHSFLMIPGKIILSSLFLEKLDTHLKLKK